VDFTNTAKYREKEENAGVTKDAYTWKNSGGVPRREKSWKGNERVETFRGGPTS